MAPMAMAMPPSDMTFAVTPCHDMIANAPSTPRGSATIAASAARTCRRKIRTTSATAMLSSTSLRSR